MLVLHSLGLGLGFFKLKLYFLVHRLTQMLSYRCLGETTKPETIVIKRISFLFEQFIPQFLLFNFLLSVYTIHSLPYTVHIETHTKKKKKSFDLPFLMPQPVYLTLLRWRAKNMGFKIQRTISEPWLCYGLAGLPCLSHCVGRHK